MRVELITPIGKINIARCGSSKPGPREPDAEQVWANARLFVAAVNFLDSLPALKKEWERRLNESDVLNALVEMSNGVMWKQPEADGHISRLTALLNAALARED